MELKQIGNHSFFAKFITDRRHYKSLIIPIIFFFKLYHSYLFNSIVIVFFKFILDILKIMIFIILKTYNVLSKNKSKIYFNFSIN